jgi:hypothetical protein
MSTNAKTIAIWYESFGANIHDKKLELHLNLWKLPNGNKYERFLDIGLKVEDPADIKQLCLYFPFAVAATDFEDIVSRFIDKPGLVSAIFNENYKVTTNSQTKFSTIENTSGVKQFDIYQTDSSNVSHENKYDGTVFKLHFPKNSSPIYLRFRVKGPYLDSLSTIQKVPNSFVQSAFSQTEMIDFRVNEARDLNKSLLEEIGRQSSFVFEKYHFFFVCSYSEDILGAHKQYNSCRNLENYRWAAYVGNEKLKDQTYLAYHWKEMGKTDTNVLLKTKFERNNWSTILKYLLVLLLVTILFNLASSYLFDFLQQLSAPHDHASLNFHQARVRLQDF